MKKLFFLMAMSCLVMFSCGKKTETAVVTDDQQTPPTCQLTEEQKAMFANWDNWDNLTDEVKATTLNDMKAFFDAKKAECKGHKEGCGQGGEKKEGCCKEGEKKEGGCDKTHQCKKQCKEGGHPCDSTKKAEFDSNWNNWENLTMDQQKALIDQIIECHKQKRECCKGKEEGAHHDGPAECPNK